MGLSDHTSRDPIADFITLVALFNLREGGGATAADVVAETAEPEQDVLGSLARLCSDGFAEQVGSARFRLTRRGLERARRDRARCEARKND